MRILYLTAGFPYPLTSGYLRHYHLVRALAGAGHEVTLVVMASQLPADDDRAVMEAMARVRVLTPEPRRWRRRLQRLVEALFGMPARDAVQMRNAVAALAAERRFQVVIISGKRTAPALEAIPPETPVVADLCDATAERLRLMAQDARGVRRIRLALELRAVERTERVLARRAARLLAASDRDARALAAALEVPGDRIMVTPNGVDTDFWHRTASRLGTTDVVFTGVMNYEPNVDAARRLIREIMPIVRARAKDTRCVIVGRDPTEELLALGMAEGVTITGFVDDVRPFLEGAAVFAAPIRYGAGVQNKLLEAMSMEVPSVVSALAADGLTTHGERAPVKVADDPQRFAEDVLEALAAARGDGVPDRAARRFVADHFVWERSARRLADTVAVLGGEELGGATSGE